MQSPNQRERSRRQRKVCLTRPLLPLRPEDKDGLQTSGGAAVGSYRKTEKAANVGGRFIPRLCKLFQATPNRAQSGLNV